MQYDVFISKNSSDQVLADSIANFLESSGLTVFESNKDLPHLGDADYSRAIFNALDNSKSIVIICSSHENGSTSKWVYDEWSWFINEIRSKRRIGQLMTIRKEILVEQLDPQLRKYESFEYDSYKSRILPYLRQTGQIKNTASDAVFPVSSVVTHTPKSQDNYTGSHLVDSIVRQDLPVSRQLEANGYDFVDLGLSVKWATCNLGAEKPEDCGDYFTWGDKERVLGEKYIGWDNYKFSLFEKGTNPQYFDIKFSKYVITEGRGNIDHLSELELSDDPATIIWGGSWRTPSTNEIKELIDKCMWQWTEIHGRKGFRLISKVNQRTMFLPAAGHFDGGTTLLGENVNGAYWTRTLHNNSVCAYNLFFKESEHLCGHVHRRYCNTIRPVLE